MRQPISPLVTKTPTQTLKPTEPQNPTQRLRDRLQQRQKMKTPLVKTKNHSSIGRFRQKHTTTPNSEYVKLNAKSNTVRPYKDGDVYENMVRNVVGGSPERSESERFVDYFRVSESDFGKIEKGTAE